MKTTRNAASVRTSAAPDERREEARWSASRMRGLRAMHGSVLVQK
jgi:hypothetical protein